MNGPQIIQMYRNKSDFHPEQILFDRDKKSITVHQRWESSSLQSRGLVHLAYLMGELLSMWLQEDLEYIVHGGRDEPQCDAQQTQGVHSTPASQGRCLPAKGSHSK